MIEHLFCFVNVLRPGSPPKTRPRIARNRRNILRGRGVSTAGQTVLRTWGFATALGGGRPERLVRRPGPACSDTSGTHGAPSPARDGAPHNVRPVLGWYLVRGSTGPAGLAGSAGPAGPHQRENGEYQARSLPPGLGPIPGRLGVSPASIRARGDSWDPFSGAQDLATLRTTATPAHIRQFRGAGGRCAVDRARFFRDSNGCSGKEEIGPRSSFAAGLDHGSVHELGRTSDDSIPGLA